MALPDLIEIVPLATPVRAEITVPGSKSITNRALALAALAEGETVLEGALWSEDTQVMVECLQALGFMVNVAFDPQETCNRTITVYGLGGKVPGGGTRENPLELFVGNAGTAARFLTALVCLGQGAYRIQGVPRMHERPQAALFQALRQLGYRIDSPNDKLPAVIHGGGPRPGPCQVSIEESSQFASALMLGSTAGGWKITVTGENAEESPYVAMTAKLIEVFPGRGGRFQIEPDCSSGSYFWAAGDLEPGERTGRRPVEATRRGLELARSRTIRVAHWPRSGWQMDERFPEFLHELDRRSESAALEKIPAPTASPEGVLVISRQRDLGDSIMTAIVLAPLLVAPVRFTDLGRLRVQECERVQALRAELAKCGAKVVESGDTLEVFPSRLHGAAIETYNDHRMAMGFAILGLKVPGIHIKHPACVKKTFPNFFQKLAAPPPAGLGATLLDAVSKRRLAVEEVFAS